MRKIPIRTDNGLARTILAGYYKYGCATLLGDYGSSGTSILEADGRIGKETILLDDDNQRIGGAIIGAVTTTFGNIALRNGWKIIQIIPDMYRIRKLTPRECGRLMGLPDSDIDLIEHHPLVLNEHGDWVAPDGMTLQEIKKQRISESQQYKMYGNSIVVQVLMGIFTQMFRKDSDCLF